MYSRPKVERGKKNALSKADVEKDVKLFAQVVGRVEKVEAFEEKTREPLKEATFLKDENAKEAVERFWATRVFELVTSL